MTFSYLMKIVSRYKPVPLPLKLDYHPLSSKSMYIMYTFHRQKHCKGSRARIEAMPSFQQNKFNIILTCSFTSIRKKNIYLLCENTKFLGSRIENKSWKRMFIFPIEPLFGTHHKQPLNQIWSWSSRIWDRYTCLM